jgi:hypothetical protein
MERLALLVARSRSRAMALPMAYDLQWPCFRSPLLTEKGVGRERLSSVRPHKTPGGQNALCYCYCRRLKS